MRQHCKVSSPADREAIIARIELQQSYEEVALALGKATASAARMTVTRALGRLLEAMAHDSRGKGKTTRTNQRGATTSILTDLSVLFREKTANAEVRSALIGLEPMSDDDIDSKKLAELIQAIADGNPVDLKELAELSTSDDRGRLLHDLQIIAGVANVHRSQIEETENIPDEDTKPVVVNENWGKFLLEKKLGEGTYGEVYLARDTFLAHVVALKLLKPMRIDRSRLLHEARTLVKVRHPNVVAVHGADVHNGIAGFWMDFIQGQTLAEVIAREGLRSAPEAAILGQDLCKALAAVHATGIVHRDIKPQNVMREIGGRVVLMDFGAVEIMERTGESDTPRMGTPLYLAPELFTGGISATAQSDIYALGVLLFYHGDRELSRARHRDR